MRRNLSRTKKLHAAITAMVSKLWRSPLTPRKKHGGTLPMNTNFLGSNIGEMEGWRVQPRALWRRFHSKELFDRQERMHPAEGY